MQRAIALALVAAANAGCLAEHPGWLGPPPCTEIPTTGTPLAEAAADLAQGEWAELSTIGLERTLLENGTNPRLLDTDSAVWFPREQTLLLAAGSMLRYRANENSWDEILDVPWGCTDCTGGGDSNALDPGRGIFYFRRFFGEEVWMQDLASGVWTPLPLPGVVASHSAMTFFPEIDRLVFVSSTGVWAFEAEGQTWAKRFEGLEIGNQSFVEHVPAHGLIVFGGGRENNALYAWDGAATLTRLGDSPVTLGAGDSVITADARTGQLIVLTNSGSSFAFDPIADVWTQLPTSPVFAATVQQSVADVAAAADTTHCVSLYLARGSQAHLFLYRHQAL